MGIGIIMPVMPDLIQEVGNVDLSQAAIWGGTLTVVFAINQFLFSPTVGGLSDAYGRRPVLLIALLVMSLDYLVMAFAQSLWLLFVGRFIGGITAATHSTAALTLTTCLPVPPPPRLTPTLPRAASQPLLSPCRSSTARFLSRSAVVGLAKRPMARLVHCGPARRTTKHCDRGA